jgi:hypothetical protein
MDSLSFVAALGLLALVIGIVFVNAVTTPRAGYAGIIIASMGVLMLAAVAVGHLLAAAN